MKSIREAALGLESEATPPAPLYPEAYKPHTTHYPNPKVNSSLFDYDNYPVHKSYAAPVKGVIEIKLTVNADELGPVGDETASQYDWNAAQNKAQEVAYDKIQELLGNDFDSKYSLEFNVYDDGESYEVSCVLTPTK